MSFAIIIYQIFTAYIYEIQPYLKTIHSSRIISLILKSGINAIDASNDIR